MADGKWITGLGPHTPVAAAARRVLEVRLAAVLGLLPLAGTRADEDPEHVHQLRVATRRARAAVDLFDDCLPGRLVKALRRRLRHIRRGAGQARDSDVLLASLAALPRPAGWEVLGVEAFRGATLARRGQSLVQMTSFWERDRRKLGRQLARVVRRLRGHRGGEDGLTTAGLGRKAVLARLDELEWGASEPAAGFARLHQVRILGKQLRYAMEVFADCFPPPFRSELYPLVEEMQEILGQANDAHVALGWIASFRSDALAFARGSWPSWRPGCLALFREYRRRLNENRRAFEDFWRTWRAERTGDKLRHIVSEAAVRGSR
jgi:CHAD domain-containing protein